MLLLLWLRLLLQLNPPGLPGALGGVAMRGLGGMLHLKGVDLVGTGKGKVASAPKGLLLLEHGVPGIEAHVRLLEDRGGSFPCICLVPVRAVLFESEFFAEESFGVFFRVVIEVMAPDNCSPVGFGGRSRGSSKAWK